MMNEEKPKGRAWLVPAVLGLVVGAILAGGPLGFSAMQLKSQVEATSQNAARLEAAKKELEGQLAAASANVEQLKGELATASATAEQLAKPDLPIQIRFRRGLLDSGIVLLIRSTASRDLAITAQFASPGGQSQNRRIVAPPDIERSYGESEGWAFATGDRVTLRHPEYREISRVVPEF